MKQFGHRVTESQSDRHPMVVSLRVCEILLCLISINSPTRLARRGTKLKYYFQIGLEYFSKII